MNTFVIFSLEKPHSLKIIIDFRGRTVKKRNGSEKFDFFGIKIHIYLWVLNERMRKKSTSNNFCGKNEFFSFSLESLFMLLFNAHCASGSKPLLELRQHEIFAKNIIYLILRMKTFKKCMRCFEIWFLATFLLSLFVFLSVCNFLSSSSSSSLSSSSSPSSPGESD